MLTKKEKEILNSIVSYKRLNDYIPSYAEIGKMVGLKSKASVYEYIYNLEQKGYIKKMDGKNRAIKILKEQEDEEIKML